MPSILCVSADSTLLATRTAVLATLGAHVVASVPSAAPLHLANQRFDCAVFCHTVMPHQAAAILRTTAAQSLPVLLLCPSDDGIAPEAMPANVSLYRTDEDFGPARLLARVRAMLAGSAQPRTCDRTSRTGLSTFPTSA
jgi:hypothetical protein